MKKLSLIMAICLLMSALIVPATAFAASNIYTTVLEDLSKDEDFDISKYPVVDGDASLDVIQIAESDAKQLFVYVYQPGATYLAKMIRFSTAINDSFKAIDYELTLLDKHDSLYKYLVEDFYVMEDALRYYSIVCLFRDFIEGEDVSDNDNTINLKACEVAQLWSASTVGDIVSYSMKQTDVVLITDLWAGHLRYPEGFFLFASGSCDSHFVAFDCNYKIDELYEVDVSWKEKYLESTTTYTQIGTIVYPHTQVEQLGEDAKFLTLKSSDSVTTNPGLLYKKHSWNRIQTVEQFIADNDLTDEALANLEGMQYVLRFAETDYTYEVWWGGTGDTTTYTTISNVTVLRLKFESLGDTFNLGVVSNLVTPDQIRDNNTEAPDFDGFWDRLFEKFDDFWDKAKIWLMWIAIVIIAVLIIIFFKPVCKIFYWPVWVVFEAVAGPFRLIILIVRLFSRKKE